MPRHVQVWFRPSQAVPPHRGRGRFDWGDALARVRYLHSLGYPDYRIAWSMGISVNTAGDWRRKLGLAVNPRRQRRRGLCTPKKEG